MKPMFLTYSREGSELTEVPTVASLFLITSRFGNIGFHLALVSIRSKQETMPAVHDVCDIQDISFSEKFRLFSCRQD